MRIPHAQVLVHEPQRSVSHHENLYSWRRKVQLEALQYVTAISQVHGCCDM